MSGHALKATARVAARWRAVSRTHVGLVRPINEDRLFDGAACGLWAVADGMGGHAGGDLAAQQVVDTLRLACDEAVDPDRLGAALHHAHADVHARNLRLRTNAGATVVAAVIAEGMLTVFWAGDSRAYWGGPTGVTQLTHDHSVVQELVDAGLIDPAAAASHPHANVVTRALGIAATVTLDRVTVPATAGRLLLCSDGLSRSLHDADLRRDEPLEALADRLLSQALTRDGSDNVSLVLVEID